MTDKERELASQRHTELLQGQTKTHSVVEELTKEVATLSTNFALHEQSDEHTFGTHSSRLSQLEEAVEATGRHKIVQLKAELAETKKDQKKGEDRWKDLGWKVIGAVVLMIVSATLAVVFSL